MMNIMSDIIIIIKGFAKMIYLATPTLILLVLVGMLLRYATGDKAIVRKLFRKVVKRIGDL